MYVVLEDSYHRYRQLSSTNQQLYRELILANATGNLVRQLNNASDISDDSICDSAQRWVYFYVHIEIFDRRGGDPGPAGILKLSINSKISNALVSLLRLSMNAMLVSASGVPTMN
jgi:hypothetical protein